MKVSTYLKLTEGKGTMILTEILNLIQEAKTEVRPPKNHTLRKESSEIREQKIVQREESYGGIDTDKTAPTANEENLALTNSLKSK